MKFGQKAVTVLVALVIVVMFHNAGMAAELKWGNDLKKAAAESQATGKPILITFTASWCHYCHKLLDETFTNQELIARRKRTSRRTARHRSLSFDRGDFS
jgi:thioredoxin-related protein